VGKPAAMIKQSDERKCVRCGGLILSKNRRAKFCSGHCRITATNKRRIFDEKGRYKGTIKENASK
jgi:hypothetical protein